MRGRVYRSATIGARDKGSHTALCEAFNAWVEEEQPEEIVHVHYYHDPVSHSRGYLVIYLQSERVPAEQMA